MSLPKLLRTEAGMIVQNVEAEGSKIAAELRKAEQKVSELQAKLGTRHEVQKRQLTYKPEAGNDPDCPYCWLLNGNHSPVKPIGSPDDADRYSCKECGYEFTDPTP